MRSLLPVGQRMISEKRGFIITVIRFRQQIHSYSLSYEVAEKIKSQLNDQYARLVTPEDADPSSDYKGLVILAAGPASKYHVLKRFAEPYLEFGLPVITMLNTKTTFAFCTPAQRRMSRVFNAVSTNLTGPCPVVMKLYCGGIPSLLPAAAKEFSKPGCKLKLAGTISDSGPPMMKPRDIIYGVKFLSSQNRFTSWFQMTKELFKTVTVTSVNGWRKRGTYERLMYSPFLYHIPQLYIYSTTDDVINIDYINKFIDHHQKHNADVTRHTFDDTLHMLHRLKHAKEYDEVLYNFLTKKCDLPI